MEDQKQQRKKVKRKFPRPEEISLRSNSADLPSKKEIIELADAANEVCAAIEVFLINSPNLALDFSLKTLLKRKRTLWNVLGRLRIGL